MPMTFHQQLVVLILETDEYHATRVIRQMEEVTPELDRLSIPAFTALCRQIDQEVRHAA